MPTVPRLFCRPLPDSLKIVLVGGLQLRGRWRRARRPGRRSCRPRDGTGCSCRSPRSHSAGSSATVSGARSGCSSITKAPMLVVTRTRRDGRPAGAGAAARSGTAAAGAGWPLGCPPGLAAPMSARSATAVSAAVSAQRRPASREARSYRIESGHRSRAASASVTGASASVIGPAKERGRFSVLRPAGFPYHCRPRPGTEREAVFSGSTAQAEVSDAQRAPSAAAAARPVSRPPGSRRARRASCIWATPARRCSTCCWPASSAAASSCASRTPTPSAARSCTSRS